MKAKDCYNCVYWKEDITGQHCKPCDNNVNKHAQLEYHRLGCDKCHNYQCDHVHKQCIDTDKFDSLN